jgi:type II secretion system protein I
MMFRTGSNEETEDRSRKTEVGKSKYFFSFFRLQTSDFGLRSGFTLIEVMVTVSVLSFGLVMLFHSFFISMDSVQYASDRLNAQIWLEEKLWEESDMLKRTKMAAQTEESGLFKLQGRDFSWKKSVQLLDAGLYALTVELSWKEAGRERMLSYATYLLS